MCLLGQAWFAHTPTSRQKTVVENKTEWNISISSICSPVRSPGFSVAGTGHACVGPGCPSLHQFAHNLSSSPKLVSSSIMRRPMMNVMVCKS